MVFSPVAPFLDHHNWHQQLQQQSNHQQGNDHGGVENPNFQSPTVPPQHAGGEGSIRPGSMVDRARLAKLPMPEPGLPCPRCESTNTKFCYFNNYSLTQPRHFCKMCRRYWTRGGALRNVPVGGGCRRNKRSNKHSRRSKSPSQKGTKCLSGSSPSRCSNENIGTSTHLAQPPSLQMPFMSAYGGVGSNIIRSSLGGFHPPSEMSGFHLGSGVSNGSNLSNILSIGSGESWRLPFLAGFEVPNNNRNLFLYQSEGVVEASPSLMVENSQTNPPVKVEENRDLNLSRQILGTSDQNTNQQAWQVGNNWGDHQFAGVSSSSTPTTHFI